MKSVSYGESRSFCKNDLWQSLLCLKGLYFIPNFFICKCLTFDPFYDSIISQIERGFRSGWSFIGDRLAAGQRILIPHTKVQILVPEPREKMVENSKKGDVNDGKQHHRSCVGCGVGILRCERVALASEAFRTARAHSRSSLPKGRRAVKRVLLSGPTHLSGRFSYFNNNKSFQQQQKYTEWPDCTIVRSGHSR